MKKIKENMEFIVLLVFILFGIMCIPAIIKADNKYNIDILNQPENIKKYNYMDSCITVYKIIDAAYRIDDGDAINCEYYDNAVKAFEELNINEFKANWKELDKDIITFLKYRAFEEGEEAAYNLLYKFYNIRRND